MGCRRRRQLLLNTTTANWNIRFRFEAMFTIKEMGFQGDECIKLNICQTYTQFIYCMRISGMGLPPLAQPSAAVPADLHLLPLLQFPPHVLPQMQLEVNVIGLHLLKQ